MPSPLSAVRAATVQAMRREPQPFVAGHADYQTGAVGSECVKVERYRRAKSLGGDGRVVQLTKRRRQAAERGDMRRCGRP